MSNQIINQLKTNGTVSFVPNGNSMWPFIKNHSTSVVISLKKERLNKYDVAFYLRDDGAIVLHRVLKVLNNGYLTCGDSQINVENVNEDSVIGVLDGFYKGFDFISAKDPKYIKKVDKWYNKKTRKFRVRLFHFIQKIKRKLKR